jgi:hypothetical protein
MLHRSASARFGITVPGVVRCRMAALLALLVMGCLADLQVMAFLPAGRARERDC